MKMQKLCAYAQGLSISRLGRQMFKEDLEAWQHGPVIACLYENFKDNGRSPIPANGLSESTARKPFDDGQKFILEFAREHCGSRSAHALRTMSRHDFPGSFGSKQDIPIERIKERFSEMPTVRKLRSYVPPKQRGAYFS